MSTIIGANAALGVALETEWGTAVSRTHWYDAVSFNVRETHELRPRQDLSAGATSRTPRSYYKASITAGGPFSVLALYEGFGPWYRALLGGSFSTSGPSGGLYTHVIKNARALPSLTGDAKRGSGSGELFSGGMVSKGVLKVAAGDQARWDFDIIAKSTAARTTAPSPVWTSARDTVMCFNELTTFTWNGGSFDATSFELTIDNKLGRRPKLGTLYTAEPDTSSMQDVTLKIELEHTADDYYEAMRAGDIGDAVITLTDGDGRSFSVTLNDCQVSDADAPINTGGIIKETVTLTARGSATDPGVTFTIVNTQSSGVGA